MQIFSESAPMIGENIPFLQRKHDDIPMYLLYDPASQGSHWDFRVVLPNSPAEQRKQSGKFKSLPAVPLPQSAHNPVCTLILVPKGHAIRVTKFVYSPAET